MKRFHMTRLLAVFLAVCMLLPLGIIADRNDRLRRF